MNRLYVKKHYWVHILALTVIVMLALVARTAGAQTREKWVRIQNSSQGYALHCPKSAVVQRYDPEGVVFIELPDQETLIIHVRANSNQLSAEQWTDAWLSNETPEVFEDIGPVGPIIHRDQILVGETVAHVLIRPGMTTLQRRIVVADGNRIILIDHPLGHKYNEHVFNQIIASFEIADSPHDTGFEIITADPNDTIAILPVPPYSQRDSRWNCDQLGTCNCNYNACTTEIYTGIGDGGCHVTSMAMIFDYYAGSFKNPQ